MINSLFQYADFFKDKALSNGDVLTCVHCLEKAATELTKGYLDLDDAMSEDLNRFDAYGNEITPAAVYDAVNFLKFENGSLNKT